MLSHRHHHRQKSKYYPFYLGAHHDRPGDFITLVYLKLDNYNAWSHAIFVVLSSRCKFGFLDGIITDFVPPARRRIGLLFTICWSLGL